MIIIKHNIPLFFPQIKAEDALAKNKKATQDKMKVVEDREQSAEDEATKKSLDESPLGVIGQTTTAGNSAMSRTMEAITGATAGGEAAVGEAGGAIVDALKKTQVGVEAAAAKEEAAIAKGSTNYITKLAAAAKEEAAIAKGRTY
jgi:hypothetical protein